jgi:hypothetical protein
MTTRKAFTAKIAIEQMDNGAVMTVRHHSAIGDTIVLKKVYTDLNEMCKDLKEQLSKSREGFVP